MDVEKLINGVVARFIGTKHERDVKAIQPMVAEINELEPEMKNLSDAEITERTSVLKAEVQARLEGFERDDPDYKEKLQEAVEPALIPAFALVREAGRRTLGMRHFDVQLIGGIVLHQGKIAEMKTGEGNTLRCHATRLSECADRTRRSYRDRKRLSGAARRGVDGADLQDAGDDRRRDRSRSGRRAAARRLRCGHYFRHQQRIRLRLSARQHEVRPEDCVQRGHHFAIVDEVDSILIDEARTPLIISGPAEESTDQYYRIDKIIPKLILDIDYTLDEKTALSTLTEEGVSKCERLLNLGNLYDPANMDIIHHVYQALRAHALFQKDVDYVIKDGQIVIVDEFTGGKCRDADGPTACTKRWKRKKA